MFSTPQILHIWHKPRKVVEITFWTPLLLPASWSQPVGAVKVLCEILTLLDLPSWPWWGGILIDPYGAPNSSTETQAEGEECPMHQHPLGAAGCPTLKEPCPSATVTAPVLDGFHGHRGHLLLFHCSWVRGDLGEESMGSQRKSNPSGVSGLYWFISVLQLPKMP